MPAYKKKLEYSYKECKLLSFITIDLEKPYFHDDIKPSILSINKEVV